MRIYCEICTELFDETKDAATTLCGHIFHENCIKEWLKYSRTCPKCRNRVEEVSIIRLFFSAFASEAKSNEYLENEMNSLKALVHRKNLEIIKRQTAEAEVKSRILEYKLRAMRLEQQVNYTQLKHMKAIMITTQWCLSLKKTMENLIRATRIMKTAWEKNTVCQRELVTEILKNSQEFGASQNAPSVCNDYSRNTRSRNSATKIMASNLTSSIRPRQHEIKVLKDDQESEAPQNISPVCNHYSRNNNRRQIENMTPNFLASDFMCDHTVLRNRCLKRYNPLGCTTSYRNIFIEKDEEFSRLSETPGISSAEISTHSRIISADREPEDYEVINDSAMDKN